MQSNKLVAMMIYGHEGNDMGKEDAAVILVLSECRLINFRASPH